MNKQTRNKAYPKEFREQVLYFTLFRQNSSDYSDARPRNFLD